MISLFTGGNGAGKTLFTVGELLAFQKSFLDRPVFVHGIPSLKLPNTQIFCKSEQCDVCMSSQLPEELPYLFLEDGTCVNVDEVKAAREAIVNIKYIENWHEWAPTGALIISDECQRHWRNRPSGSRLPECISRLETHRHRGLDFWLIAQSGAQVDQNIRALVTRHIHFTTDALTRRVQYEWGQYQSTVTSTVGATKRKYALNKKNFELYKSSEFHTKQQRNLPLVLILLPFFVLFSLVMFYFVYQNFSSKMPEEAEQQEQQEQQPQNPQQSTSLTQSVSSILPDSKNFNSSTYDFMPRVAGRAETAPAYDGLTKVVDAPRIATCASYTVFDLPEGWEFEASPQSDFVLSAADNGLYLRMDGDSKEKKRLDKLLTPPKPYYYHVDNFKKRYEKPPSFIKRAVCNCYTQQHTIYETTFEFCNAWVNRKVFNPYVVASSSLSR